MTEDITSHQERIARDPQLLRREIDAVNMLGVVGERRNIGITLNIIDSRQKWPRKFAQAFRWKLC